MLLSLLWVLEPVLAAFSIGRQVAKLRDARAGLLLKRKGAPMRADMLEMLPEAVTMVLIVDTVGLVYKALVAKEKQEATL